MSDREALKLPDRWQAQIDPDRINLLVVEGSISDR